MCTQLAVFLEQIFSSCRPIIDGGEKVNMARLIMNQFRWLDRIVNSKVWLFIALMVLKVTHILVDLWCYTCLMTGLLGWFGIRKGNLHLCAQNHHVYVGLNQP